MYTHTLTQWCLQVHLWTMDGKKGVTVPVTGLYGNYERTFFSALSGVLVEFEDTALHYEGLVF